MLRISATILFLSPAIASAQCVTSADLNTGVTVEYANGNVSHIQRAADGTLLDAHENYSSYQDETIFFGSHSSIFQTARVTHQKGDWEAQGKVSISYDFAPESVTSFAVGERGNGTHTAASDNGYESGDSQFGWMVYESAPLEVGNCSYAAVRVFTSQVRVNRGDVIVREVMYLSELGFGIVLGDSYYALPASNYIIANLTAD